MTNHSSNELTVRQHHYRALNAGTESTLTYDEWHVILADHKHLCAYCGEERKLLVEHQLPLSRGGGNTAQNVVPACSACNSSKGNRTVKEWREGVKPPRPPRKHIPKGNFCVNLEEGVDKSLTQMAKAQGINRTAVLEILIRQATEKKRLNAA